MFESFAQYGDFGLFVLRLAVGGIFIYHALPKIRNAKGMSQSMGMPAGMILILGLVEGISSLGLIFGIYTGLAALLLSLAMIGAIYFKMVKWHVPFSATDKTGWEFDLILLAANILILTNGGGAISIM